MQAFTYENGKLALTTMPEPTLGEGEVMIRLKVAGLNRRDLYIPSRVGVKKDPLILGSDGAGVIEAVGRKVTTFNVGDDVIINPSLRWFDNSIYPPKEFGILGMPDHGTLAEKIVVSAEQVELKPAHLSWEEAGVLALAALTGYRALFTQGELQKGQTVFIPGAGSGVATYLMMFAKHAGARVIVTSRSKEKREKALKLGADIALDTSKDWREQLGDERIDLVIESVGRATFNRSLDMVKLGGRLVVFGATTEDEVEINLRDFFYGQYHLIGSTMGSREELREMIRFIQDHKIKPVLDHVFPFPDIQDAMDYLEESQQFGKIAVQINP